MAVDTQCYGSLFQVPSGRRVALKCVADTPFDTGTLPKGTTFTATVTRRFALDSNGVMRRLFSNASFRLRGSDKFWLADNHETWRFGTKEA
ncbi:hypothetical protein V2A28_20280 [Pseudomonas aeruginosa]|nr:hypothetical protein [Pseudomonas aeruginosa]